MRDSPLTLTLKFIIQCRHWWQKISWMIQTFHRVAQSLCVCGAFNISMLNRWTRKRIEQRKQVVSCSNCVRLDEAWLRPDFSEFTLKARDSQDQNCPEYVRGLLRVFSPSLLHRKSQVKLAKYSEILVQCSPTSFIMSQSHITRFSGNARLKIQGLLDKKNCLWRTSWASLPKELPSCAYLEKNDGM